MRRSMDLRAIASARIAAGRPLPLIGRLLADVSAERVTLLDPSTGAELAAADDRPAFVLSTEGEATDGHIVRQFWDLSRANGAGVPILWNHNPDVLLGQWQDIRVADMGDGRALVARAFFDPDDELAQKRKAQVKRGILNATSVGWLPGDSVRRGELDKADPHWREPMDGPCGPEEGLVMGSATRPNQLIEGTITPTPADQAAVVIERLYRRGAEDMVRAARGEAFDADRLLAFLANEPRARAYIDALVTRRVRDELSRLSSPLACPDVRTVADLLRSGA